MIVLTQLHVVSLTVNKNGLVILSLLWAKSSQYIIWYKQGVSSHGKPGKVMELYYFSRGRFHEQT